MQDERSGCGARRSVSETRKLVSENAGICRTDINEELLIRRNRGGGKTLPNNIITRCHVYRNVFSSKVDLFSAAFLPARNCVSGYTHCYPDDDQEEQTIL